MTLIQFAKKYDMPYTFVVEASIQIFPIVTPEQENEYNEQELYEACREKLREKLFAAREKVSGYSKMLDRLVRIRRRQ